MARGKPVDLSYKRGARRAYYDIEVLHDIFTILLMTKGHVKLVVVHTDDYANVSNAQLRDEFAAKIMSRDDVVKAVGAGADFDLSRYLVGSDMSVWRKELDTILSCGSLWEKNQFTEYYGWNSANYDLPMLCMIRLLFKDNRFDPADARILSDAIISFDGKPWKLYEHVAETTGLIKESAIKMRLNLASYADGHIDLSRLARIVKSDDTGSESKFPPGLKKEMARFGMDIVVDEAVSAVEHRVLSDREFIDLCLYNANDVVGTALVARNKVIVGQLETRDAVREMYPYTSARATPLDKIGTWSSPARDTTAANLAGLVLIGENRAKPVDYPTVRYTFPLAVGEHDLLEYMREHEDFMHPMFYQFFDHFRGRDTASSYDNYRVQKSQPITHSAQMNVPYYRDGKPVDSYIRVSTGGAHGSVMAGLSSYDEERVDAWIRSDIGATKDQKPTLDLTDVVHVDWSSFYPTMASKMQMYKTADGVDRYTRIIEHRIEIKKSLPHLVETWGPNEHALNQNQDGLKFLLNSATGAGNMHQKYALLPLDNKTQSMRLIGNMHIWCLAQRLTQAGAFIVSTNTDGVYMTNISVEEAQRVIDGYIAVYGMGVEPEIVDRFINRDTSNRIEYQGTNRSAVSGRLRHGVDMRYTEDSIGKNVSYPLAAAHAVLEYMDDPSWLSAPYDRSRLADIVHGIYEKSHDPEPWYHVHAGTTSRRMTLNGKHLGKVNRVVLTTEGDTLGSESATELNKAESLALGLAYRDRKSHQTILDFVSEAGYAMVRELHEGDELSSYRKDEETGEPVRTQDYDLFRLADEPDQKASLKLAILRDGVVFPLKVWKPAALTGYTSNTGMVLNESAALRNFDMSLIDESAYVRWAEQLLAGWKITADLPEIGMVKLDDTVIPDDKPKRVTKHEVEVAKVIDIYTDLVESYDRLREAV